jgi:hypothetical protein
MAGYISDEEIDSAIDEARQLHGFSRISMLQHRFSQVGTIFHMPIRLAVLRSQFDNCPVLAICQTHVKPIYGRVRK